MAKSIGHSKYDCLVLNLYDRVTPKPTTLYNDWKNKCSKYSLSIFNHIRHFNVTKYFFAYGDLIDLNGKEKIEENQNRINKITGLLKSKNIDEIKSILNLYP